MKVSKRLEIALRQNQCKQRRTEFVGDVAQALGRPQESIRTLDLEQTDALRDLFDKARNNCMNVSLDCFLKRWHESEVNGLKQIIADLRNQSPNTRLFLFRPWSEYCGAVETSSKEVLDRAFHLISLDQDELMATNDDASVGINLSYDTNKYETGNTYVYELITWGKEYLNVLAKYQTG